VSTRVDLKIQTGIDLELFDKILTFDKVRGMKMKLRDDITNEIKEMDIDELLFLKEQIRLLRKAKSKVKSKYTLEEVRKLTSSSKSNWADDVIKERQERG
jgi:hypothetical protein